MTLGATYLPQNHHARPNRIASNDKAMRPQLTTPVRSSLSGMVLAVEYTALAIISPTTILSLIETRSRLCATMVAAMARHATAEAPPTMAVATTIELMLCTEAGHGAHACTTLYPPAWLIPATKLQLLLYLGPSLYAF